MSIHLADRTEDMQALDEAAACWCCGTSQPRHQMLHLGNHPEVNICISCAHFLHKQANGMQDDGRAGLGPRSRDAARRIRRTVVERGWHRTPLIGRPIRWIGRYLP